MTGKILLVEDDEIITGIIEEILSTKGFAVVTVSNGQTAWSMLQAGLPGLDTILLDRELPGMNGMDLLRGLKTLPGYEQLPVVMETAADDPGSIRQGMEQGVYYYLTKPFEPDLLLAIVSAAVAQYRDYQEMRKTVEQAEQTLWFLDSGVFHIQTLEEAHTLASSLAKIRPELRRAGLGLQELMINAIEHGNLGISYREKTELVLEERLLDEVERRRSLPEYRDKFVELRFERLPEAFRFTICDQGQGFEWEKYLDFDIARIFDPNGRGIAMARKISFDSVDYLGNGNTVVATVAR